MRMYVPRVCSCEVLLRMCPWLGYGIHGAESYISGGSLTEWGARAVNSCVQRFAVRQWVCWAGRGRTCMCERGCRTRVVGTGLFTGQGADGKGDRMYSRGHRKRGACQSAYLAAQGKPAGAGLLQRGSWRKRRLIRASDVIAVSNCHMPLGLRTAH